MQVYFRTRIAYFLREIKSTMTGSRFNGLEIMMYSPKGTFQKSYENENYNFQSQFDF